MIYGLHVASAGDFYGIPTRARAAGGDVLQYFAGNPRGWQQKVYTPDEGAKFQKGVAENNIQQTFIHMSYLTSYGSPNESLRQKSIDSYQRVLQGAEVLGTLGVVTHLGSHKGTGFAARVDSLAEGLLLSLEGSQKSFAILENSAGAGDNMCNTLEELATVYERTNKHPRIKFCLDTCHTLTAGYEIRTPAGLDTFLEQVESTIGLGNVVVMHLNDSKFDIDTHRDRHENIGDGFIGQDGFKVILNHPALKNMPGILEVPGLDGKGPDKANVDRLRALTES